MSEVYSKLPKAEIDSRIARLKDHLKSAELDGALMMTTVELYYYSGIGTGGAVYVPAEDEPIRLVERNLDLVESYSLISEIKPMGRMSQLFQTLNVPSDARIAMEADVIPFSLMSFLQSKGDGIHFSDGSDMFRKIRSRKSDYEIELIEAAARIVDQSFEYCTEIATPEMTEIALSMRLDAWMVENGHAGFITTRSFTSEMLIYSYVVSSSGSTLNTFFTPVSGVGLSLKYPLGPTRQKLGRNRPFLVDSCGNMKGYHSDTTRTFICGRFDDDLSNKLDSLSQVKNFLLREMKPGTNLGDLYGDVIELSIELGIHDQFMGVDENKVSFIGHGVGLELDELPIFYSKGPDLEPGNVLACEPKIVTPGREVLGIEDTYVITSSGNRSLSIAPERFEIG
ncbi:MAG: M24 family metallopeptidase [Candidatus Thorarchaeota archaeon]|jgi:Xaa-Pro aminopeptidase